VIIEIREAFGTAWGPTVLRARISGTVILRGVAPTAPLYMSLRVAAGDPVHA
jgi:hypothetical protein